MICEINSESPNYPEFSISSILRYGLLKKFIEFQRLLFKVNGIPPQNLQRFCTFVKLLYPR